MLNLVALASETVIDASMVTEVLNLVKSVMSLFKEFPLNVLLIGSLSFLGFAIFRSAKRAVR